jgi:hypothetical protein
VRETPIFTNVLIINVDLYGSCFLFWSVFRFVAKPSNRFHPTVGYTWG